jgi:hypothetical protein
MDAEPLRADLYNVFAATNLITFPDIEFALVGLPSDSYYEVLTAIAAQRDPRFQATVRTPSEVTVIIPKDLWELISVGFPRATVDAPWKLISLDITIPLDMYGYLEQVTRVCAEQGASVMLASGYTTDHLLVAAERYQPVIAALQSFIDHCRSSVSVPG